MLLLDRPFVSSFLQDTARQLSIPVLNNPAVQELGLDPNLNYVSSEKMVDLYERSELKTLYCNSEEGIAWIAAHLAHTPLPGQVSSFKDKVRFRDLLSPLYPGFFYQAMDMRGLDDLASGTASTKMPYPAVIKPAVGFFSTGVYLVHSEEQWPAVIERLKASVKGATESFPPSVLDASKFIIEEAVRGIELAVDVYFDVESKPVIVNVMQHVFSSGDDTSDRLYITSKDIVLQYHDMLSRVLGKVGLAAGVTCFPMHVEVRVAPDGTIGFIEANPMRFAGYCVTDMTWHAFGLNNYELFFNQERPDWEAVAKNNEGKVTGMVVGTLPEGIHPRDIKHIDHAAFCERFPRVHACQVQDYHQYPLFSITFVEFDEKSKEIMEWALKSDFREFISLKNEN